MTHYMSTGEQITGNLTAILPILIVTLWIAMLVDWHRRAKNSNRYLWLLVIIFGGLFGYVFFFFSKDRIK